MKHTSTIIKKSPRILLLTAWLLGLAMMSTHGTGTSFSGQTSEDQIRKSTAVLDNSNVARMQHQQDISSDDVTEKNMLPFDSDQDGYFDTYEAIYGSDPLDDRSQPSPSIYVDATALPGGDGSLEWPLDTIQKAINTAIDFDIIQLADGTYAGLENKNLNFRGKPIMLRSEHGPETCLIDCEGSGRGVLFDQKENGFSVLWGITILNGDVFDEDGGAIHSRSTSPTIRNCLFINNAASRGGAIFLEDSSPRIQDSFILSNIATLGGGGIFSDATSDPVIEGTVIEDNLPDQVHGLFRSEPKTGVAEKDTVTVFGDSAKSIFHRTLPTQAAKNLLDGLDTIRDIKTPHNNEPFPFLPIPVPNLDSDGDGLPNQWEVSNSLNPNDASDGMTDPDGDGFGNAYEFFHDTDPRDRGSAPSPTLFVKKLSLIPVPLSPLKSLLLAPNPLPPINPQPNPFPNPLPQPVPNPTPTPLFYTTIQTALDAANDYDIIEVAKGTYSGTGNKDLDYKGKPIMLLSEQGPDHTVIDCEGDGRGFRFFNGEDKRSVLRGVTIKNGRANRGAGISCEASSPTIQECVILGNHALQKGGGLYNDSSSPMLINLILAQNQAHAGGAVFNDKNANPILQHCTLANNAASSVGGGLGHLDASSTPEVRSTILWGNLPDQIDHLGNPMITFSDIQGGWFGQNNIDADPQLTAQYHLTSTSPCINRGNPLTAPQLDIDGESRAGQKSKKLFFSPDIGADEFVDTDLDGLPDIWENKHFGDLSHNGTEDNDSAGGADGLSNLSEYENGTDPNNSDTDKDGLLDGDEIAIHGTSPTNSDTDGDGLPDDWEIDNRLNPNDPSDRMSDLDQDGFGNLYEFFHHTDPHNIGSAPDPTLYVYPSPILPFGPQPKFRTIQAALDAATDFDIIELADGTYTGVDNKDLNYQGKPVMVVSKNGSSETVIDCEDFGRGVHFFNGEDETSVLRGVTIKNGRAGKGAGISCEASSPTIQNCVILRNLALQEGGGLYNESSSPILVNMIVAQNQAPVGGAVFNGKNTSPIVRNCTISDNTASSGGGIAHLDNSAISDIINSILWGNTPEQIDVNGTSVIGHSNIQGGWTGQGNVDSDPQLTPLYRLKATSPCIHAGNLFEAPSKDIDGENRIGLMKISIGVDIGADEFVDTDIDGLPDDWEMKFFGDLTHDGANDNDRIGGPDGLSNLAEYENGTDPNKSDTDGDGLQDGEEIDSHGTSPIEADTDNDGLNDGDEIHHGSSPNDPDTDGDGLEDGEEITRRTSPTNPDTDGDGIDDGTEVANGTSPQLSLDFDRDGMPDDWETHYGLKSTNPADASEDPDNDDLTNLEEYHVGTNPKDFDTDGDFLPDGFEQKFGLDPTTWDDPQGDTDGDGLSNLDEVIYGTDPTNDDTDGDGTEDGQEAKQGSYPTDNSDGGQAPSPEDIVEIELTVGDPSSSESERYNLVATNDLIEIKHQALRHGVVETRTYNQFRRGETYKVTIRHTDTDPAFLAQHGFSNFDWIAKIRPLNSKDCIYIEDPDTILTEYIDWPNDTFLASNKTAYLHIYDFDVDIDSDNDNDFEMPSRTYQEDELENHAGQLGKIIGINNNNDDNHVDDRIPDFADGFNWDMIAGNDDDLTLGEKFVPIVIELSDNVDLSTAKLSLNYDASEPAAVGRTGNDDTGYTYTAGPGHLRLWSKDGNEARDMRSVGNSGHYIPSGTYNPTELGFSTSKRTITLFLEGIDISTSAGDQQIEVILDPDGPTGPAPPCTDTVKVTVIEVELVRGDVDPGTGRGATGSPNDILHSIDPNVEVFPVSSPRPLVVLESVIVGNVSENSEDRLIADITVSGYVTTPFADIVPNHEADPKEASVLVADRDIGTVALTREPEPTSLLRPYAAKYTFTKTFSDAPLVSFECGVVVSVEDPATGNTGFDSAMFNVTATRASTDDDGVQSLYFEKGLSQPSNLQIDFGQSWTSLSELAAQGQDTIHIRAKKSYDIDAAPISVTAGLELDSTDNPWIRSSDGAIEIEVTESTDMGLSSTVKGTFKAMVQIPDIYWEPFEVTFEETASDSNIYESRFIEMLLTLDQPLDPDSLDNLSVRIRKTLWDSSTSWQSAQLVETGKDSREFGTHDLNLEIIELTGTSGSRYDEMTLRVNHNTLDLSDHHVDATETGFATLVFDTSQTLSPTITSLTDSADYDDAWLNGPWATSSITYQEGSDPGFYMPFLIRVNGPVEIANTNMKMSLFGVEHSLVVRDGVVYSAGSGEPGNFATTGRLKVGEKFGAGHISKKEGFVWATLGKSIRSKEVNIYRTADKLYDELKKLADDRRTERTSGTNPGSQYWAPTYKGSNDPRDKFIDLMWSFFEDAMKKLKKDTVDLEVRKLALELMNKNNPKQAVMGIPHSPNALFVRATVINEPYTNKTVSLEIKKKNIVATTGSKYLIGHWFRLDQGINVDFANQTQNITDFVHFNAGLGWGKLEPIMMSLKDLIEKKYSSDDARAKAIMKWLRENGYLAALSKKEQEQIDYYGDIKGFNYGVKKSGQWKEVIDIFRMAQAFGPSKISALDFFLAYDIASGEAFHVFGIDAFNDVIATEAGFRMAKDLEDPKSGIHDKATLKARLEKHMKEARAAFLSHPVMADKSKRLSAFYSVMMNNNGTSFVPVTVPYEGKSRAIWKQTLGTILQKNKSKLTTPAGRNDFVSKVVEVLEGMKKTTYSGPEAKLSSDDIESLHQAIEMLSLLNE